MFQFAYYKQQSDLGLSSVKPVCLFDLILYVP